MATLSHTAVVAGMWLVAAGSVIFAAEPSTQPATQPSAELAPAETNEPRVVVAPFTPAGESAQPWIADAVQRALVSDLSRLPTVAPEAGDPTATADARFVITGSYQLMDDGQLRFVGQVFDKQANRNIAGLKATGSQRDLFAMEDSLSAQAARAIAQATGAFPAADKAASADANRVEPSGPIVMRPYNGSSLEDSLKPDSSTGSGDYYNRYMYGSNGVYSYGGPYSYYGRPYTPFYDDFVDYGYYPQPYYYPYNYGYGGSRVYIFSNNNDGRRNFHHRGDGRGGDGRGGDGRGRGGGSVDGFARGISVPAGTIVTPQAARRGFGNSNGYMPMTMQGGLRNYNGAMPNANGAMPNANRAMPMSNRAIPMSNRGMQMSNSSR